ncbi:MAG: hypothetical protein NTY12_03840 [Candidatus Falkowbacteria bacterium]|nr:hypothetical protein [Candidatus Falkowbacteria bacterium]
MEENKNLNEEDDSKTEAVVVSKQKLMALRSLVANLHQASEALSDFISGMSGFEGAFTPAAMSSAAHIEKTIEGVFDGEKMIGSDGKQYAVPVNYASKSKLVEGDLLKLSVTDQGTMIYKQIQPIDRLRLTGNLEQSDTGDWTVTVNGKRFKILGASVTYFKGEMGDEVIILVPKTGQSRWAAVEHIFKKT